MNLRPHIDKINAQLMRLVNDAAAAFKRARTQQVDLKSLKTSIACVLSKLIQTVRQRPKWTIADIRPWLKFNGQKIALYVGAPIIGFIILVIVNHQISRYSDLLALKPAQLTAIEALVYESKYSVPQISSATALTDNDLETIRVILQNRGINTNILRLNLEQGVQIEVQADQVPFGQWVAFLDEVARRWQLYPIQLNLQAKEQPESVSIRATLQQSQAPSQ